MGEGRRSAVRWCRWWAMDGLEQAGGDGRRSVVRWREIGRKFFIRFLNLIGVEIYFLFFFFFNYELTMLD